MKIRVFPQEHFGDVTSSIRSLDHLVIDLSAVSAYIGWHNRTNSSLKELGCASGLAEYALRRLLMSVDNSYRVYLLRGPSSIYSHRSPSGEPKLFQSGIIDMFLTMILFGFNTILCFHGSPPMNSHTPVRLAKSLVMPMPQFSFRFITTILGISY